jgi:hypothetical protein
MIVGLSIETFVLLHVGVSFVGIISGIVALTALAAHKWLSGWQVLFLASTTATSVTGFMFPISGLTPALIVGGLSLAALSIAAAAWFVVPQGRAVTAYALGATTALYLNLFVLVVQSFQKIDFLQVLAPTQSEMPFVASQIALLAACLVLGRKVRRGGSKLAPKMRTSFA